MLIYFIQFAGCGLARITHQPTRGGAGQNFWPALLCGPKFTGPHNPRVDVGRGGLARVARMHTSNHIPLQWYAAKGSLFLLVAP